MMKPAVALRLVVVVAVAALAGKLTCCESRLLDVGGRSGWTMDVQVNYTDWASHLQFYVGDWLYFRFDKHKYNVLEVNRTNYETCNDREFIKNITRGGRDVVQLTESRPYYYISSGGYCYGGLKLAINVSRPLPPALAPDSSAAAPTPQPTLLVLLAAVEALIWFSAAAGRL